MFRRASTWVVLTVCLAVTALHVETLLAGRVYHMDDAADGYYPSHVAAARAYAHGELPAWEPRAWCGWPLGADPYYAAFYPPTLLFYLAPVRALAYMVALHAIGAGLALAWLVRRRGGSYEAATLGALGVALSLFVVERIRHVIFVQLLFWLVLALVGIEGYLTTRRRRELALVAVAAGMMLLCGALPLLPFAAMVIGAYTLPRFFAARPDGPSRAHALAGLALAGILGLLLGCAQLLPTLAHLPLSPRALGTDFDFASSYAWPELRYLALLVAPHLLGQSDRSRWFGAFNYWEMAGYYVGVWPVLLGLFVLVRRRKVEHLVWWLLVALAAVLAFGKLTPVHRFMFDHLPLYAGLRCPTRALVIFVVLMPLLGAEGLDALLRGTEERWTRRSLRAVLGAALALVGVVIVLAVYFGAQPPTPELVERNRAVAHLACALCLGVGALVALTGTTSLATVRRAVVLVSLIDLLAIGRQHIDARPGDWAEGTDHFHAIEWLRAQQAKHEPGRFIPAADGPFRLHNAGMTYDLESAGGYDSVTTWYIVHFLWLINHRSPYPHAALKDDLAAGFMRRFDTPLVDLMNIRWAIATAPPTGKWIERMKPPGKPLAIYEPQHDARLRVYENPNVLPRAFAVFKADVQPDDKKAARALLALDPRRTALLAETPVPAPSNLDHDPVPGKLTVDERSRVVVDIDMPAAGVLVVSDTFYPGWSATVDGARAPLLRADYAFEGIALPEGHHQVELRFRSVPTLAGLVASLFGLLGALVLARRGRVSE